MNLPNTLTVIRIVLVPLLVVVLLTKFEGRAVLGIHVEFVAAAIFGLASLTDWLDGYLARRRQQITWVGEVLDPIADKLLISAVLISLVQLDLVAAWMAAVIIGREFAVTGLRSLAFSRGLVIAASPLGKLKMVTQIVAVLLLLLGWERFPVLLGLGRVMLWVAMAATLGSAADYFWRFSRAVKTVAAPVAEFAAAQARRERARSERSGAA
ncbi:MAG: CDP-diacylglycerol--glycerol-3-phosphate 3-phosphatidyltransferase [Vicinamibacterales bacterium]